MPRNLHRFCPETCTVGQRFLEKPLLTLHTGMECWKEKHLARWNDAELRSSAFEPCLVIQRCLLPDGDSMRFVRLVIQGERGVKSSEHVPPHGPLHTRQWIGTYAGRGNGDYRGELASSLQTIVSYLMHFALTAEVALVRLDGQYGDAAVIAQIILTGVHIVTRGRGYQILEHPQIQRVLLHPPTASVTSMNTGEVVDLFDGGWQETRGGITSSASHCCSASSFCRQAGACRQACR